MLVSFLFLSPKSFLVSKQGKLLDMDEKWMTYFQCAMERSVRSYSRKRGVEDSNQMTPKEDTAEQTLLHSFLPAI